MAPPTAGSRHDLVHTRVLVGDDLTWLGLGHWVAAACVAPIRRNELRLHVLAATMDGIQYRRIRSNETRNAIPGAASWIKLIQLSRIQHIKCELLRSKIPASVSLSVKREGYARRDKRIYVLYDVKTPGGPYPPRRGERCSMRPLSNYFCHLFVLRTAKRVLLMVLKAQLQAFNRKPPKPRKSNSRHQATNKKNIIVGHSRWSRYREAYTQRNIWTMKSGSK